MQEGALVVNTTENSKTANDLFEIDNEQMDIHESNEQLDRQRKQGINLTYLTAFLFTIAVGFLQFGYALGVINVLYQEFNCYVINKYGIKPDGYFEGNEHGRLQ